MWPLRPASADDKPRDQAGSVQSRSLGVRIAVAAIIGVSLPALGALLGTWLLARASDDPSAGVHDGSAAAADSSLLISTAKDRLIQLIEQLVRLGPEVLHDTGATERLRGQVVNQKITVKSAEATYETSKLTREIAEIAIVEYEEGIFLQDQTVAEGELKLAESAVLRAEDAIAGATFRIAEIKKLSRDTPQDKQHEKRCAEFLVQSKLREPRARLALESARLELVVLRKYSKPKRVKELQSAVEKARSDELAAQARWEGEKLALQKLQDAVKGANLSAHDQRALTALDQAAPIIVQLKAKLTLAKTTARDTEPAGKEITAMLDRLEKLIHEAQAEHASAKWEQQKPKVHAAASRSFDAVSK